MNCTTEIRSTAQISALMALQHTPMVGLVLMEMSILCIYDIPDYCHAHVGIV